MNIIIIDSDEVSRLQLSDYCKQLGISNHPFSRIELLESWLSDYPDIKIDMAFLAAGSEESEIFQQASHLRNHIFKDLALSIIFVLQSQNDHQSIQSLKYGDGFLVRPFSSDLFLASINTYSKHRNLNHLLAVKNKRLTEYQQMVKREHNIVEAIFSKHCHGHMPDVGYIKSYISPASVFNGDVLLSALGPTGNLFLGVGDVTGHGLPAAVGALPIYATFRTMAKKGKDVGLIAAELNQTLRDLLPDHMMMGMTLIELNSKEGLVKLWAGGMPDVLITSPDGKITHTIESEHAPLSMLEPELFRTDIQFIQLSQGERLYLYTDGIEEAHDQQGNMLGTERFRQLFQEHEKNTFQAIIDYHQQFIGGYAQDDDITLVEVTYENAGEDYMAPYMGKEILTLSVPWSVEFTLTAAELKKTDPLAQITNFLNNTVDIDNYHDYVSTILSELYNNALDHGVLGLNSSLKDNEDGFIEFYLERTEKLASLQQGEIHIQISYHIPEGNSDGKLSITVKDSGDGFDHQNIVKSLADSRKSYGRGISLLNALCQELHYEGRGNQVTASYSIDRSGYSSH